MARRTPHAASGAHLGGSAVWRSVPLVILCLAVGWVIAVCAGHYVQPPLFRDPGMYQYAAWCLLHGERLYDTVTLPEGPFIYLIDIPAQLIARSNDAAYRTIDLAIHAGGAALMGAVLSQVGRNPRHWERALWSVVSVCVWLSYIFNFGWLESVQRDGYYGLFGTLGLVFAYAAAEYRGRVRAAMLFLGGFVPALVVFGKQSGVLYVGLAALTIFLAFGRSAVAAKEGRLPLLGAFTAAALMLGFIVCFGSLRGYVFWHFVWPLKVYRFYFSLSVSTLLSSGPVREDLFVAVGASVVGATAISLGALPRRAWGLVLAPALQLIAALLQGKSWRYHFHPAIAGAHGVLILLLVNLWIRGEASRLRRGLAWLGFALVSARCAQALWDSPWLKPIHLERARDIQERYFLADYLEVHTRPDDRVFYYGIDPYALLLAGRRPATPEIVALMLNFAPAFRSPPPPAGRGPNAAERVVISRLQKQRADDTCARLNSAPPAALVFINEPPNTSPDALADILRFCPSLQPRLSVDYRRTLVRSAVRVYLRRDRL